MKGEQTMLKKARDPFKKVYNYIVNSFQFSLFLLLQHRALELLEQRRVIKAMYYCFILLTMVPSYFKTQS